MSMPREARQARLQLDKLLSAFSIITINSDHCNIFVKALYFTRSTLFFIFSSGSVQLSSVTQSCPTLCDPMDCSTPGLPVHHQLPEFTQTHVHWDSDTIQPSYPLLPPSPPAFNLSQHQGLFRWVSSSHQVAKVLEFQLQHQSFEVWTLGFCKSHFCFAFWPPIMFYQ